MSRSVLISVFAILASLGALVYLRTSSVPNSYQASRTFSTARSYNSPPSVSRLRPGSAPIQLRAPHPLRTASVAREASSCESDPFVCGEGYYCCQGKCEPGVYANVTFAADDYASLYVCGWKDYEPLAKSSTFGEVASYQGWLPCKYTYLNVINDAYDGGASIAFIAEESGILWSWGSGGALPVDSQYGYDVNFEPAVPFDEIADKEKFITLYSDLAAYPVKDPRDPGNKVTNLRFMPPTCR